MARKTHSSPAEARDAILDAAQAIVVEVGPAGLRLSAVAKKAGMAHPNIIHHFGSRDGLIDALAERVGARATDRITKAINEALQAAPQDRIDAMTKVLDTAYAGDEGKVAVWLHMSGTNSSMKSNMRRIVDAAHALRESIEEQVDMNTTNRLVMLVTMALVGEVVSGAGVKESLGFSPDSNNRAHFRRWLAELLLHLSTRELDSRLSELQPPARSLAGG